MERTVAQIRFPAVALPRLTRVAAYARVSSGKDAMLVQLVEPVSHFLPVGLDSKVGLAKRDNLFARIAVLDDKITGIPAQFIIHDPLAGGACLNDFPDLRKIVGY